MSERPPVDESFLQQEPAEAHVVRWYMERINDAYGSGEDYDEIIDEMYKRCYRRVIMSIEEENHLARQSIKG